VSGKGGVGKSVLAVNLGAVFTKHGRKSVVVDADVNSPSVGLQLGIPYTNIGLQNILHERKQFQDAIIAHPATGLRILPASLKYMRGVSLKNFNRVISEANKAYEFTIIDSPPGITEDVLHIINASEELVVITTPDVPSVSGAIKVISLCKACKKRIHGVVVNRCTDASFELTVREIESMTEMPVLVRLPEDDSIPASIATHLPVVHYAPDSAVSRKLNEFALSFIESGQPKTQGGGLITRLFAFIRGIFA